MTIKLTKILNPNAINLGQLDDQEKKHTCWAPGTISGSRVARIMNEPKAVLAEWLGDKEEDAIPPVIQEKMKVGTFMEDVIFTMAQHWVDMDICKDKNTYQIKDTQFYFNIDGISSDGETIFEIKNTETTDVDVLVDRYKYQATWYILMTGAKKVTFIFFIRGCKMRYKDFVPSEEMKMDVMHKVITMLDAYNAGRDGYDLITWGNEDKDTSDKQAIQLTDDVAIQKLNDLVAMKEDYDILGDRIKEYKEFFAEALGGRGSFIDPNTGNKVSVVESTRKGAVDVEATTEANPGMEWKYKNDYTTKTVKITKGKGAK